MKEEFEYGEEVMVRDHDTEGWVERLYIDTVEFKDTGLKLYCTHPLDEGPNNHDGYFHRWRQIRKLKKPETIEVPKQLLLDILTFMEKDIERYNNTWGADWPLTLEEYIEQGKMPKYYYELRKLLPKT